MSNNAVEVYVRLLQVSILQFHLELYQYKR